MWLTLLVIGFVIVLISAGILTAFGLPGNWVGVIGAAIYNLLAPASSNLRLGWGIVIAMLVLAILGELVEFVAGALGVRKTGGSRRSAVLAMGGSLVGGLMGAMIGLPIPIVGPIVAVILFSGLGAFGGAVWGEYMWIGQGADASVRIGMAAFWARILGTLAKCLMGVGMIALAIIGMIV